MKSTKPFRIKTITEYHRLRDLPKPEHPLISVIDINVFTEVPGPEWNNIVFDFYSISLKRTPSVKYRYGQRDYDFDEGVMFFMAPNQVFGMEIGEIVTKPEGWILLIHPDFLWGTTLAKTIKHYEFFGYAVSEALFLSAREETVLNQLIQTIQQEYFANIDKFSQNIMIAHLEALLNYADRFYQRQFITRKKANHQILNSLEKLLTDYFNSEDLVSKGLPTVQYVSAELNTSPNYLRGLLKALTGLSTQQHIHEKLIEKAKEKISTTNLSISEIAYELGFEHPPSFSKLFKNKTSLSPVEFRQSFR